MKYTPNLTTIHIRRCAKCGRVGRRLDRHHKGYESLFASILPSKYQDDYDKFRPSDIVDLCHGKRKCHSRIHQIYARRLGHWGFWTLMANQGGKLTFKQCEHYRRLLIQECHEWLARGNKLRQVSRSGVLPPKLVLPSSASKKQ